MCSIGMSMLGFIGLLVRKAKGAVMPAVLRGVTAVMASTVAVLSVASPTSESSSSLIAAAFSASTAFSTCVATIK